MVRACILFLVLITVCFSLSAATHRAQPWKPINLSYAQRLPVDQLQSIVLPQEVGKALDKAATDLQALYLERFGQEIKIVDSGRPKQSIIFKKSSNYPFGAFSIRCEGTRLIIRGSDEESWINAIYAICRDALGARWYWSGADGFEWNGDALAVFPLEPWLDAPAFVQRHLYPTDTDYGRRNRLNSRYSFNHNLARIFTPELFENEPEVFASVNGRRKKPNRNAATDPQPDFTNSRTVEIAAQAALRHFEAQPKSTSYSLSINDNSLFDTSERTRMSVSPMRYFRDRPNYSDLVFGFMNQVAEKVFDQAGAWQNSDGQDRYLTALSYYWTEPVPSFPVHSRVMPVLTSDRAQWHDPDYREQDKELIHAWAESGAERIATWDYYFGSPYNYPRQFNQWIGESIPYLYGQGVDVFFSQLPSFWEMDGAKAWLTTRLLWDPSEDVDELLDEFYTNFFGPAALSIRQFYEFSESYRNLNEGKAEWIKLYKDAAGIELFTPDSLRQMRAFVDQAYAKVEVGSRYATRVQRVSHALRFTELYAAYQWARRDLVWASIRTQNGASESVAEKLSTYKAARARYRAFIDDFFKLAQNKSIRHFSTVAQSHPIELARAALNQGKQRDFRSFFDNAELKWNGSKPRNFLGPDIPLLGNWFIDFRPSEGFSLLPSRFSQQQAGLRIVNADMVSLFTRLPVISKQDYLLRLRASWQVSLDNRVHIQVRWTDQKGKSLSSKIPLRFPLGAQTEPVSIEIPLTAPANAYDLTIRVVTSRQYPGDYIDLSELDFGAVY